MMRGLRTIVAASALAVIAGGNDHAIGKRFGIGAWPSAFLVDRTGVVRYRHIGEGADEETEAMIRQHLAER
jgi:hypothetical protein